MTNALTRINNFQGYWAQTWDYFDNPLYQKFEKNKH